MVIVLARNWWAILLRGIVALLFGALTFIWPGISLIVLAMLFGSYVLTDGVFAVRAGVSGAQEGRKHRWALLIDGLVGIVAGLLAFGLPGGTASLFVYLIAAWAIVTGILEILAGIRLRKELTGEWRLILAGYLWVVCGILLMSRPGAGVSAVVALIDIHAIIFGVLSLALALRLRSGFIRHATA